MATIAFIGTGNMGTGMAARLICAGHDLKIYNRTKEKAVPLEELGAVLVDTPALAAVGADVIFAMVGDDNASDVIWNGENGVLSADIKPGTLAIECSTLSYDWVKELSNTVQAKGLSYLDCPVTGMPPQAAAGELTLLIGGEDDVLEKAEPYLSPLCINHFHFGGVGAGTAYKLIVNLMGSVQIVACAEGILTAEKAGLNMDTVVEALSSGACASAQVKMNSPVMAAGGHDDNVLFSALWRLKDTDYGVKFADQMGTQRNLGIESLKQFQKLVDEGHKDSSGSKVIETMRS
ncbi:dehydrogenase [Alphaproteobacteria bacterium 46_93_T64]|nr:dehydrogenase [Alphaproteobacteria bacterium 46_93_T64]